MSANFSLLSWLTHLPLAASCIDGDGRYNDWHERQPRYYALAEDWKGSHCPYPKLPEWCRQIFDARVTAAYWFTAQDVDRRVYYRMLEWRVPVMWRKRISRLVKKACAPFHCRRRGYSWHFHCSLCGHISFFDLAGSKWACKQCGKLNPATPEPRPRFSVLDLAARWSKLCAKLDKKPKWACCQFCGQTGNPRSWNGPALRPTDILTTSCEDITGRKQWDEYTCFRCRGAAEKIQEWYQHRDGGYQDGDVKRWMRHWLRTGQLPEKFAKHWEAICPF